MAKMFYTLEETAARLGVNEEKVKALAADGKLQQFRDRDKLMFKRDQVDAMAGLSGGSAAGGSSIGLADSGIDNVDILGDTDSVNPSQATDASGSSVKGTGVNVFDAGEVEHADPLAQTQMTRRTADDEALNLDTVGSGSGLLDLTRESDDTSLGVALDEIYPGGSAAGSATGSGAGSAAGTAMESAVGSSGVFESALGMESAVSQATGSSSGLDHLATETTTPGFEPTGTMMAIGAYDAEAYDPAGSGFGAGMLLGALIAMILGLIVTFSQIFDVQSGVTTMLAGGDQPDGMKTLMYLIGLVVISFVLGGIGFAVGRAAAK
ncbi:MAG: helix-turn-helix domain-containing protein [Phycisphaeraceae bacterium]|nr:helix-turn-helix domain-containing protein [Phycisphaeraceae bacterium]